MRLIFEGGELMDSMALSNYKVQNGSIMGVGFAVHSEMSENNVCKDMVLAWCILQATETCIGPINWMILGQKTA